MSLPTQQWHACLPRHAASACFSVTHITRHVLMCRLLPAELSHLPPGPALRRLAGSCYVCARSRHEAAGAWSHNSGRPCKPGCIQSQEVQRAPVATTAGQGESPMLLAAVVIRDGKQICTDVPGYEQLDEELGQEALGTLSPQLSFHSQDAAGRQEQLHKLNSRLDLRVFELEVEGMIHVRAACGIISCLQGAFALANREPDKATDQWLTPLSFSAAIAATACVAFVQNLSQIDASARGNIAAHTAHAMPWRQRHEVSAPCQMLKFKAVCLSPMAELVVSHSLEHSWVSVGYGACAGSAQGQLLFAYSRPGCRPTILSAIALNQGPLQAELHLHIEGTLEPASALQFAQRNGMPDALPYKTADEALEAYSFSSLQSFLDLYYAGCAVLQTEQNKVNAIVNSSIHLHGLTQNPSCVCTQDFFELAWAYLRRAHANQVAHVELFWDPQTHTERGVAFETSLLGIHAALQRAEIELRMTGSIIMCFLRHLGAEAASRCLHQASQQSSAPPVRKARHCSCHIAQGCAPCLYHVISQAKKARQRARHAANARQNIADAQPTCSTRKGGLIAQL
ncbi:hypothetical protein MMC07_000418 [Pseudocyphellaria aurata]|nr:hypothetical protein [Pseudocyphellaria aurata]